MKIEDLGDRYKVNRDENFSIIMVKPILSHKSLIITLKQLENLPKELKQFIIEKVKIGIVRDIITYETILEIYDDNMFELIKEELAKYD